jgi:hypothetical protein
VSGVHAPLAPSSAGRWRWCAGSPQLERLYPDTDGEEAREGDAAHWVARTLLLTGVLLDVGVAAPNGVVIDHDMQEGANLYSNHVLERFGAEAIRAIPQALRVELATTRRTIHPQVYGTPDGWALWNNVLDVWDYKYGFRYVEVFENQQLLCYVADIIGDLPLHLASPDMLVRMHIIQPRSYRREGPIRTWEIRAQDLLPYFNELRAAAERAVLDDAQCTVGAWCRDCKARHACTALQQSAYDAAAIASAPVPFDLTASQTGSELKRLRRAYDALKARVDGLETQAMEQLRRGEYVPHWGLGETKPHLTWNRPIEDVIALGQLYGKSLTKPPEPITPTQAIKLGIDETVISQYSFRPRGSLKLVPADVTQARKVFAK